MNAHAGLDILSPCGSEETVDFANVNANGLFERPFGSEAADVRGWSGSGVGLGIIGSKGVFKILTFRDIP